MYSCFGLFPIEEVVEGKLPSGIRESVRASQLSQSGFSRLM